MTKALLAALIAMTITAPAALADELVKTPVEVWRTSDDAFTAQFADVVAKALGASPAFVLAASNTGAVKVQIDAITGQTEGVHGAFNYRVEVTPKGQATVALSGNCYQDAMEDCASFIVDRTYGAVKRSPPIESPH